MQTFSSSTCQRFYVLIACSSGSCTIFETMDSLAKCTKPDGYAGLILVENGTKKSLRHLIEQSHFDSLMITYSFLPLANKSGALNHALEHTGSSFLFFTDDDALLDHKILIEYAAAAEQYGKGHYFGGPVERSEGSPHLEQYKVAFSPRSVTGWLHESDQPSPKAFLGVNWGCFSEDIKAVDGFIDSLGPGSAFGAAGQETTAQAKLYRKGIKPVYIPEAIVAHRIRPEAVTVRWLLKRRYLQNITKGLLPGLVFRGESPGPKKQSDLRVLVHPQRLVKTDWFKAKILGALMVTAELLGIGRGLILRWHLRDQLRDLR